MPRRRSKSTHSVRTFDELADVFLELKSGETLFLNNALLENGQAVRMDGDAPHERRLFVKVRGKA